jgi:hypothetical protein
MVVHFSDMMYWVGCGLRGTGMEDRLWMGDAHSEFVAYVVALRRANLLYRTKFDPE